MEDASLVRRLLLTILMAGVFLGGYYLGRIPGSPDVIAWVGERLPKADEAGAETTRPESEKGVLTSLVDEAVKHVDRIASAVEDADPQGDSPRQETSFRINGKTYRLGE